MRHLTVPGIPSSGKAASAASSRIIITSMSIPFVALITNPPFDVLTAITIITLVISVDKPCALNTIITTPFAISLDITTHVPIIMRMHVGIVAITTPFAIR